MARCAGNVEEVRANPLALGAAVLVSAAAGFVMPPTAPAATPCWKTVIADWSRDGSIDGRYPDSCYRQAMQSAPTDLKVYSTLEDDLQSALRERSARRLAGVDVAAASIDTSGSSSSLPLLVTLIGGLALVLGAGSTVVALVRRRAR